MNKLTITTAAALVALAAGSAFGTWEYEGEWGEYGAGNGQFYSPGSVTVAPSGRVYVADTKNNRVQFFTPTGSFLGKWGSVGSGAGQFYWPMGIAVAPGNGYVYVTDPVDSCRVQYFTRNGSFLGKWGRIGSGNGQFRIPMGIAVAPNGTVYVADCYNYRVQYFTPSGSFLGKWGMEGTGEGQFILPSDVAVAPNGRVYVVQSYRGSLRDRVQYFTATGYFLGMWARDFYAPLGLGIGSGGKVFVADTGRDRVQYFTGSGSFLGMWGTEGSAPGEFKNPEDVAVSPTGVRAYVADTANHRIQYSRWTEPAVTPTSLGRVRALFK